MQSRDFCYWLQGYFEMTAAPSGKFEGNLSEDQVQCIRNHLNMVFVHEIDPSFGDKAHQAALSAAHSGGAAGQPPKPTSPVLTAGGQPDLGVLSAIPKC